LSKEIKHSLLPLDAQRVLKRAALTLDTRFNPLARRIAVDQAIKKVMRNYPQYFKEIN